jgi:CHAT domain-containing protein/Tfp pilus assembly protein PilF
MRPACYPLFFLLLLLPNFPSSSEEKLKVIQKLASDIISASTDQQRNSLLSSNPDLITSELTQALLDYIPKLRSQGLYEKGIQVCDLAKQISNQVDDKKGVIDALNLKGSIFFERDKYDACRENYEESLKLSESIGYTKGKADSLNGTAWVLRRQDELEAATKNVEESLTLYQSIGNKSGIARAFHLMGIIQSEKGDWESALKLYEQSLKLREELSERLNIAYCYMSMGNVYGPLGREDQAEKYFKMAVNIFENEGEKRRLASTYNNLANLSVNQGDLTLALNYHLRSLAISQQLGLKDGEGNSMINIGVVHEIQGNYDLAMDYYQKALALSEQLHSKTLAYFAMGNIASIEASQGKYQDAIEQYQKTLALGEQIGRSGLAMLARMADIYDQIGEHKMAYEYFKKCLTSYEQGNNKDGISGTLHRIAKIQNSLRDYEGALKNATRAEDLAKELDFPEDLWQAQLEEGRAHLEMGDKTKAIQALENSITGIELMRQTVAGSEVESQLYFAQHLEPYSLLVNLLLSENKNREAFTYAERAKARVLFDVLKGGKVQITKSMTEQETEQEQALVAALQNLNAKLLEEKTSSKPEPQKVSELQEKLQEARLAHESFRTNLYASHPELKIQRGAFEVSGLESALEILDPSEALLEYVVSQDQTNLFVFTKKSQQSPDLQVYSLPITEKDLSGDIGRFRTELANRDSGFSALAKSFYDRLLKTSEEQLKDKKQIIIIPDRELWELPFQALQNAKGQYLLEKYSVSYAPSLTVLSEMMKSSQDFATQPTVLAFGNPTIGDETQKRVNAINRNEQLGPIPEAEDEVRGLSQFYGKNNSHVYVRNEASEDIFKSESGNFGIIHIAAHGILNDSNPMYSHLALAPGKNQTEDGLLEPWEIMNLNLNASMVVLSACETARGKVGAGEGMIGFSWAFFVAGSPSVVVSQWSVNSESTTKLMQAFHKQYRSANNHLGKSDALRNAALSLMKDPRFGHPHYWAGFVVVGDPR